MEIRIHFHEVGKHFRAAILEFRILHYIFKSSRILPTGHKRLSVRHYTPSVLILNNQFKRREAREGVREGRREK